MSGKKPKYNKNYTFYDRSSININKIKEIKADSNINISSFNNNDYKYKTSLTPSFSFVRLSYLMIIILLSFKKFDFFMVYSKYI